MLANLPDERLQIGVAQASQHMRPPAGKTAAFVVGQMLEQAIDAKQLEIVQARQDEAVFEKLKEKELLRFQVRMEQQEKLLMDDIYISKARRQAAEGEKDRN